LKLSKQILAFDFASFIINLSYFGKQASRSGNVNSA